jgi:hypothetical protein
MSIPSNGKAVNGRASSAGAESTSEPGSARDRARASGYTAPQPESDRKPASERESAFNLMAWLLEGATGVVEELRHNDLGLSEEFWTHAYAARTETLLAMRAALDTLIERSSAIEREEAERNARRERRGGINIEF